MRSYEIQVFKAGKWEFDSYFKDRESAMFDADQLAADTRVEGVRVLKENYDEASNTATCDIIFTRLRKKNGPGDWRKKAQKQNRSLKGSGVGQGERVRPVRRKKPKKKKRSPVFALVAFALVLLAGGIVTMMGLGGFSKFS